MRRLLTASAGAVGIGAFAYKPYVDPIKYSTLDTINDSYDYIVIGSGTSGSVVARRLAEQDNKPTVLLLEAGPPDSYHLFSKEVIPLICHNSLKTKIDWEYYTEPNSNACKGLINNRSYWPRGKVCGGSSVLNAMMFVRGHPNDFNEWDNVHGCKGWNYQNVVTYFKKIENPQFNINDENKPFRGNNGLQKISVKTPKPQICDLFVEACKNEGFGYNEDYNGKSQDGVTYTQYSTYKGQRMTSFRSYIAPLFKPFTKKTDYNIHILPYSHCTKILSETSENKNNFNVAKGVEIVYKNNTKNKKIINNNKNGEILLCAGAINSPQILLLSGIGPKNELKEKNIECIVDAPGVGKNLQDHMLYGIRLKVPGNIQLLGPKTLPKAMFDYLFKGNGWLTSMSTDVQLFCTSEIGTKLGIQMNDLQLVAVPAAGAVVGTAAHSLLASHYNIDKNGSNSFLDVSNVDKRSMVGLIYPLHPTSFGEITLKNNNPLEHPIINYQYLQTEYDKNCFVDGVLLMKQIMENKIFKQAGCKGIVVDNDYNGDYDEYWSREAILQRLQKSALTNYHPVGTCKMGNIQNDIMSVCDERLKVRGFENLRVIDASIMPTLTSGNTQAPCYMIAEKGADMVIQDSITLNQ